MRFDAGLFLDELAHPFQFSGRFVLFWLRALAVEPHEAWIALYVETSPKSFSLVRRSHVNLDDYQAVLSMRKACNQVWIDLVEFLAVFAPGHVEIDKGSFA